MAGAKPNHDYHLVEPDPWPIIGAFSALSFFGGLVMWMHDNPYGKFFFAGGVAMIFVTMFTWWSNTIREAHAGDHTPVVQLHLRYGMILFIASEVMFFVAWFWGYFDAALYPAAVQPLDITGPDGTVEASKEIIGMIKRDELFGGHWPPRPAEVAETSGYFHGTFDPWS